jgi:hypothetical protein
VLVVDVVRRRDNRHPGVQIRVAVLFATQGLECMAGDVGSTVQSRHDEYLTGCHIGVRRQVVRQCDDRREAIVPVPASGQSHEGLARYYGVVPHIGEIRDVQPGA